MTPLQMALAAAAIGNLEGKLMKPKIEFERAAAAVFNQVVTPQAAARLRAIMGLVTGGSSGTARGVFGPVKAAGINTGGKTGTAQKVVPVYDPKTGEPKTRHQDREGQSRQHHSRIRRNDHGQRESADRWLVSLHRAARETAAGDGSDRRRRWLRIAIGGADCGGAGFESEGPWVFQIRRFSRKAQSAQRKEADSNCDAMRTLRFALRNFVKRE